MRRLDGLGVVITRPSAAAGPLAAALELEGARVFLFPALSIEEIALSPASEAALASLPAAALAIFVSANAAERGLAVARQYLPWPCAVAVAAIGEATAQALRNAGVGSVISPTERHDSEALLELPRLQAVRGENIIVFRGEGGRERLKEALEERGASVSYVECYRRVRPATDPAPLLAAAERGEVHAVGVLSAETLENFVAMLGPPGARLTAAATLVVPHAAVATHPDARRFGRTAVAGPGTAGVIEALTSIRKTMMNESPPPAALPPPAPLPPVARGRRDGRDPTARTLGAAALVGAVVLAWIAIDARRGLTAMESSAGGRLAELGAESVQARLQLKDAQAALKDAQARIGELEARVADTQEQRVALEEMYRELSRNADDRLLAEVEQMLVAASQQLQLAGNVRGALAALQAADQRLARAEKLSAAPLRRAITQDIEKLKAVPMVDTVGIAVKLDGLIAQTDGMPLLMSEALPAARPPLRARSPENDGFTRAARDLWEEMKGLVRIRDLETPDVALLAPAQSYFLRENLRLRLLSARVALLARDEGSFREDLKAAQAWLAKYFDPKARPTGAATAVLKQLMDSPVAIGVPDINASLAAVRTARASRERR